MTVATLTRTIPFIGKLRATWTLIKSLQTGLLLVTGLAGYASARPNTGWHIWLGMAASLFLAICGSTVLNMIVDQDIDAVMKRTAKRPLVSVAACASSCTTMPDAACGACCVWSSKAGFVGRIPL